MAWLSPIRVTSLSRGGFNDPNRLINGAKRMSNLLRLSIGLLFVWMSLLTSWVAFDASRGRAPVDDQEGLLRAKCGFQGGRVVRCVVNLQDLAAHPRIFDQKKVLVTGYLVVDKNALSLYSSEDSYRHRLPGSSLELRGPAARQVEYLARSKYKTVRISGMFDWTDEGSFTRGRIGVLRDISSPWEVDAVPREEIGDLGFREGDL